MNSTLPLLIAAERRLPIVDAYCMGRAFSEFQSKTLQVCGVPARPVIIVNEHGNSAIIEGHSSASAE